MCQVLKPDPMQDSNMLWCAKPQASMPRLHRDIEEICGGIFRARTLVSLTVVDENCLSLRT